MNLEKRLGEKPKKKIKTRKIHLSVDDNVYWLIWWFMVITAIVIINS